MREPIPVPSYVSVIIIQMIRTRFAPSPTGLLHVGGIRTALFAWLLARQQGGKFVLRLEDTDQAREVAGADQHIMDCLHALGLHYDEGPDKAGEFGPYRQSERLSTYKEWAQKLVDSGRAYADPYSPAEVQGFREAAQKEKRPFLYRNQRPDNPPSWDGSQPLRFKAEPKAYEWHDAVMGDLKTGPEVVDDFILIKSDGYPTYNFAHIIDDMLMQCTHVIRGQEFLASTPNYLNLYEALGLAEPEPSHMDATQGAGEQRTEPYTKYGEGAAEPATQQSAMSTSRVISSANQQAGVVRGYRPILATMPHILGPDGNKKLSKRDGAKDVLDYVREGYPVEALINFIASMGWNDGTEQEVFSVEELIEKFSLDRVQKSGARFDEKRLEWLSGAHIRSLKLPELANRVKDYWPNSAKDASDDYKTEVLGLVQERLKRYNELPELTNFFFEDLPVNPELITGNKQLRKLSKEEITDLLTQTHIALELSDFDVETLQTLLNQLLEKTGQKPGTLFSLIRIATTQSPASPGLAETLAILGKEISLRRIDATLSVL